MAYPRTTCFALLALATVTRSAGAESLVVTMGETPIPRPRSSRWGRPPNPRPTPVVSTPTQPVADDADVTRRLSPGSSVSSSAQGAATRVWQWSWVGFYDYAVTTIVEGALLATAKTPPDRVNDGVSAGKAAVALGFVLVSSRLRRALRPRPAGPARRDPGRAAGPAPPRRVAPSPHRPGRSASGAAGFP